MHVIQGGWVGQTYALATSSDAGGKKSRIRRSKEERKTMVESFIRKYQKSNKGDFPSLNLTHKEVGGSFYTVREIVREVIQENRVLAPPKKYIDGHNSPGFLEEQSRPAEHQNNLTELNQRHAGEHWSISSLQFGDHELRTEQVFNRIGKAESNQFQDTISEVSKSGKKISSSVKGELENENIVNESEGHVEDTNSDKLLLENDFPINCDHGETRLQVQPDQKVHPDPLEIPEHSYEQDLNNNELISDDAKTAIYEVYVVMNDTEVLSNESTGGQDTERPHLATLKSNSVVEVEISAVKPGSETVLVMDGKSIELNDSAERSDCVDSTSEKLAFDKSNSDAVNDAKDEKNLKMNHECEDVMGNSNDSGPTSSPFIETKVAIPTAQYTSKGSAKVGGIESKFRDKSGAKQMDRINLETWKGASKKSDSNPVVTLVKAFLSAFFKLWSQ